MNIKCTHRRNLTIRFSRQFQILLKDILIRSGTCIAAFIARTFGAWAISLKGLPNACLLTKLKIQNAFFSKSKTLRVSSINLNFLWILLSFWILSALVWKNCTVKDNSTTYIAALHMSAAASMFMLVHKDFSFKLVIVDKG